jgi:hypothetical protein
LFMIPFFFFFADLGSFVSADKVALSANVDPAFFTAMLEF